MPLLQLIELFLLSALFRMFSVLFGIFGYTVSYMERSLNFYLNRDYVYCQYYAHDGKVALSAGLKVDPEKFRAGELSKVQKAHLGRLRNAVYSYEANTKLAGRQTSKADVMAVILSELGKDVVIKPGSDSLLSIYTRYLEAVKAGEILNDGKRYSDAWVKTAGSIKAHLVKSELGAVPVGKIREDELRLLHADFINRKLSKNTISAYMAVVVGILNSARGMRWYDGSVYDTAVFRATAEDIDHGVYLNPAEIKSVSLLGYSGKLARYRDAFVLGCYLGLRYSDLSRLGPDNRTGSLINTNTKKTGTPVWVPLSGDAKELWERYQGELKMPSDGTFREAIKDIGKDAGIDRPCLFSRTEGGVKIEKWMPKYDLLGTHSMRRSFATNAYRAGVPMPSIMKVTGHKSTESFLKYIRLSDEEHAEMLLEHPHFK